MHIPRSVVVNLAAWEAAGDEQLGTKPKQWFRDPDGVLWLWKESLDNDDGRRGSFRKGDDWSEVVAARVGIALGVPVAEVRLASLDQRCGVISRRVFDDDAEFLAHGNELLPEIGVVGADPHDRTGYTLDAVATVLTGVRPPVDEPHVPKAFDWFAGYLVLDAVVGNNDRHQDNWAVIQGPEGRRLSPSFDHASCLGFLLSDDERAERLRTADTNRTIASFASRTRSKFEGNPPAADVAVDALRLVEDQVRQFWIDRLLGLPPLPALLEGIEADRMSELSREFAAALYEHNRQSLSHRLRTMAS